MKYLKSGGLKNYGIADKAFTINPFGRISTNSTNSLKLPTGTQQQRPDPVYATNGVIRYNTDNNTIEGIVNGNWEIIKVASSVTNSKQTITGFNTETYFGPLDQVPASGNNLLVLVSNVLQVFQDNFVLETDPSGSSPSRSGSPYPAGTYIRFPTGISGVFETLTDDVDITIIYGFEL